ncbi:MAG: sulfate ABC transporter permease subunit CysT [Sulfurospirillum sp.]
MKWKFKNPSVLPGFGLTLGFSLTYVTLLVLIPLGGLLLYTTKLSWSEFGAVILDPRVLASFKLSFGASFIAALINLFFGLIVAWTLARYNFFGKKIVDALVDLPFALPTAVAGIALAAIFASNGWIGSLLEPLGIQIAYSRAGVIIALIFIGLPFVVRTVQPVIEEFEKEFEEASTSLGASWWQTFSRVILPSLLPALLTGFALSFARALGEYGSIIFISSNMPCVSEIVPLIIVTKLSQFDYVGATAVGTVMLLATFVILFFINAIQIYSREKSL